MATVGSHSLPHDAPPVDLTIRLIMIRKEITSICSGKGAGVKRFEKESGTRINIPDLGQIVTITGTTDAIFKAVNLVCNQLEKGVNETSAAIAIPRPQITLRLIISAADYDSLVDKGGLKINDIREITGATMVVQPEKRPNSTERTMKVSGSSGAVSQCVYRVCFIMIGNLAVLGLNGSTETGGDGLINAPALAAHTDSTLRSGEGLQTSALKLSYLPSCMGFRHTPPHQITIIFKEEIANVKLKKIIRLSGAIISISFGVMTVTGMRSSIIKAVFHLCRVVEEISASPSVGTPLITIRFLMQAAMWNFLIGEAAQEYDGLSEISGVSSAEIITSDGTMKVIGVRNCVSRYINYLFGEMFEFLPNGKIDYRRDPLISSSQHEKCDPAVKVHIGQLDSNVKSVDIENAFKQYGAVKNVWMFRDRALKKTGYALVEFAYQEEAKKAVGNPNGIRLGDKSVKVQMFKVKKTTCGGIPGNRSKSSEVNEVVGDNQGANLAQGVIEENS